MKVLKAPYDAHHPKIEEARARALALFRGSKKKEQAT